MHCELFRHEVIMCCQCLVGESCACYFSVDKSSQRLGALQHLGEKGDKMTAMLVQVREILPKYRSGSLPKVFKVLPKFQSWEEVQYIKDQMQRFFIC